jgi:hypothetical protein
MPVPILSLTAGLVFHFTRVDLRFRNGHHALCKTAEVLKRGWLGCAHA